MPVVHTFYTFVAKDAKLCGFPTKPTDEELKVLNLSPYYNLSVCIGDYIAEAQKAFVHPNENSTVKECKAAMELNNCLYHQVELSPMSKVARQQMARLTMELEHGICSNLQKGK